ncbi:MAG TPA: 4-(cytidine 5'-diphospho)-2-C-methyl-D-erythritol kinase, partial [Ferruginibacter sp.]|nr:4-(cytidine 5'-diphospho)-2-C-methyl-D-erythritol kinase [Ferruginibacter sp.]
MIVFPNCKINLGLHILDKRHDGFHNLETGFYPIPFNDALEIIPGTALEINTSGFVVDGKAEDNLCMRAYQLLKNEFPELSPVRIHLHKAIPMGAGLGGGSADAAYMLKLLNERFQLGLSTEQLINYSLQLGSDAPFFIINKPCFATGRGEILEEIAVDLSKYRIIIINPGIHINTGWAFANRSSGLEHPER